MLLLNMSQTMYRMGLDMQRTQLYLTQEQINWLKKTAKQESTTAAEINRRAIDICMTQPAYIKMKKEQKETLGEFLRKMALDAKKCNVHGPKDLATNTDKYLYHI